MTTIFVVVLAMAYLAWVGRRATRRRTAGLCIRCGRNAPVPAGDAVDASMEGMCAACVGTTARNHRAGFWFFVALAFCVPIMVTLGVISDVQAGFGFDWIWIPVVVVMMGGLLLIAAFIRALDRARPPDRDGLS